MYTSIGRRSKYVRTSVYYIEECAAPIASPPTTFYHCDRPMSLLRRRPVDLWRNLCASLLYFVVRVTVAISSTDELLVFTADVFTVAVFLLTWTFFTMDVIS